MLVVMIRTEKGWLVDDYYWEEMGKEMTIEKAQMKEGGRSRNWRGLGCYIFHCSPKVVPNDSVAYLAPCPLRPYLLIKISHHSVLGRRPAGGEF